MLPLLPFVLFGGLITAAVASGKRAKRRHRSDYEIFKEEWFRLQDLGDFQGQEDLINVIFDDDYQDDEGNWYILPGGIIWDIATRSTESGYIRDQLLRSYADVTPEQQDLLLWWALERVDQFPTTPILGYQYLNIINEILVEMGEEPVAVMDF